MAGKFKLFNYEKEGKGVRRGEKTNRAALYFAITFRKFWGICKVSLICSMFVIPVAVVVGLLIVLMNAYEVADFYHELCFAPCILLGPAITGAVRVTRDFAREEPVFIWSDFVKSMKNNFKQSLIVSAINYVIFSLLYVAVYFYFININSGLFHVIFFGLGMMFTLIFLFMQYYIYLMIVSMDLNIKQLYKNAAIFAIVSLWKNFLTTIILAVIAALSAIMIYFSFPIPLLRVLWILLIFGFFIGFALYTVSFISYPSIKKYAIDPYYEEHKEKTAEAVKDSSLAEDEEELPEYVYENGRMVHRSVLENESEAVFNDDIGTHSKDN